MRGVSLYCTLFCVAVVVVTGGCGPASSENTVSAVVVGEMRSLSNLIFDKRANFVVSSSAKVDFGSHNVGGLPEQLGFQLIEPLRDLFKDEVRKLGLELGLPEHLVWRHPFPGPGLAVRCLGEVTREKLEILRDADEIVVSEIKNANLYRQTSQAFAVLLESQSVGVMGDARTYERAVAVRCVNTDDFMTADWSQLPYDLLAKISTRIINEVRGVNRVCYDISSKPPATIEWE